MLVIVAGSKCSPRPHVVVDSVDFGMLCITLHSSGTLGLVLTLDLCFGALIRADDRATSSEVAMTSLATVSALWQAGTVAPWSPPLLLRFPPGRMTCSALVEAATPHHGARSMPSFHPSVLSEQPIRLIQSPLACVELTSTLRVSCDPTALAAAQATDLLPLLPLPDPVSSFASMHTSQPNCSGKWIE
eukprot:2876024-Rhodomonas_salina.1